MTEPNATPEAPTTDALAQWGDTAPRGGRAVLNRMLKGDFKVPLFFGQTLVKSLRDQGYSSTTSALCEFVDNSFQWGATEVRVYIVQDKKGKNTRILIVDNGRGMSSEGQRVAMSFGGSMAFESRTGISRFGMGMKTAALSISPTFDNYTWQEPRAYYSVLLDVNDLGKDKSNMLEVPEPQLNDALPSDIVDIVIRPTAWPKNPQESQTLLATDREELHERLGKSGTIVYLPECDRLTYKKEQTLAEHAVKEMGRVYRRFIAAGKKLYVNNRLVEAFDPTYQMPTARHARVVAGMTETRGRLIFSKQIDIPVADYEKAPTTRVTVKLFALPYAAWIGLGKKVLRNDLHVYGDFTTSFMRNDREVEIGSTVRALGINKHHMNNWLRVEIDFTGDADEGFGIASNKQGVRLRDFAADPIRELLEETMAALRKEFATLRTKHNALQSGSAVSEAEQKATGAEGLQDESLPPVTPEQQADLEKNLRALAIGLKRGEETDEQAFDRVSKNKFLTHEVSNEYYPFFDCEYKYERVILTVNTAHPFYQTVWSPLLELSRKAAAVPGEDEDAEANPDVANTCTDVLVGLQLLFFSLARTQAQMAGHDKDESTRLLFKNFRKKWSSNLETQLRSELTSDV